MRSFGQRLVLAVCLVAYLAATSPATRPEYWPAAGSWR